MGRKFVHHVMGSRTKCGQIVDGEKWLNRNTWTTLTMDVTCPGCILVIESDRAKKQRLPIRV